MSTNITRRRVLRSIAAGAAATGMAGEAIAEAGGRKIVGLTADAGFEVARRRATDVYRELDFGRIGKAVAGTFSDEAVKKLERNPNVRYVERDGEVHALAQTLPWGIDRVDADVLHTNGETGSGADIAIIDTGIDDDHPDLQANIGTGYAVVTCSGSNCNYDWSDDNNHGTHCAGIADAIDNTEGVVGVSTEATLHAVKVLDSSGGGTWSGVAEGIKWTADQGYDVGSMSLGASSGSSTLKDAVQYADGKGVLQVAAAGNSGPCSDCVGYPAAYSEVIAVSATSSDDTMADFSSTGPEVELAAPGENVYSTIIGGYDSFDGTSMACPHVSGAGGHLRAKGYTKSEARQRLQDTAEDIGHSSNEQGYGLLDAEAAVLDDGGDSDKCVDATLWPAGTGYDGYEHITNVQADGNGYPSSDNAYYDFTCPDVITVEQGGSFDIAMEWDDGGYNSHYANIFIDWDQNQDWSTAPEYKLMENVDDDTIVPKATISVPENAPTGGTLLRLRLSWGGFKAPDATGEYGEVNDFTVYVTESTDCVDATLWPAGTGYDGYENIDEVNLDGQVVKQSADNPYEDFTCPDVVQVSQGGSFTVSMDFDDAGYDSHYGNIYIDWDQNGDWSTATEYIIMENVNDDTVTYSTTVDVPTDATLGETLVRVRLSWSQFYGPTATDEFGEVNDFTVSVQ